MTHYFSWNEKTSPKTLKRIQQVLKRENTALAVSEIAMKGRISIKQVYAVISMPRAKTEYGIEVEDSNYIKWKKYVYKQPMG